MAPYIKFKSGIISTGKKMTITLTQQLKETIEKLFTKPHLIALAKVIVSRILLKYTTQHDNISGISKQFCQIVIGSHKILYNGKKIHEYKYVLTILEQNNIIKKKWEACPQHNSPSYYSICTQYLELKDTITTREQLKNIIPKRYQTFRIKSITFLDKTNADECNKRTQDINWSEKYTNLLTERYLNNFTFNKQNILSYIRKQWNDNTITDYDNLKINTYRQLQISNSIYFIEHPQYLSVHVGNIGGRLHHQLCSMVKQIWLQIYTFISGNVKLSIDIKSCQVYCFQKYFGPLPQKMHNALSRGLFYEYINDTYYRGLKTRQNIKKIIFSKFFNGNGKIWKDLSKTNPQYAERVLNMIAINKKNNKTTAGILQRMQSQLFNNLFKVIDNSIIRYDQIIVSVLQKDIDKAISQISSIINTYFNTHTNIHILIDNNILNYTHYYTLSGAYVQNITSSDKNDIEIEKDIILNHVSEKIHTDLNDIPMGPVDTTLDTTIKNNNFKNSIVNRLTNLKRNYNSVIQDNSQQKEQTLNILTYKNFGII